MRKGLILTLSLIVSLLGAAPAVAEPEPDNWIWQATGPVTSGSITGTIASNNDHDWYMLYVASQSQLTITLQASNVATTTTSPLTRALGTR